MAYSGNRGLRRLVLASKYSAQGFAAAWRNEEAFRQEVLLCVLLLPLALWLGETGVERALLIGSVLLLPIVELLNSAIEAVVDRFGGELHELSARAKDIGSAAVSLAIVNLVLVWLAVLWP